MTAFRTRRTLWGVALVCGWLLVACGAVAFAAHVWVRRTFGPITVDQLLTNLDGTAAGTDGGLGWSALLMIVVIPLAVVVGCAMLVEVSRRSLAEAGVMRGPGKWALRSLAIALAVAVPVAGAGLFSQTVGAAAYLRSLTSDANLADMYVEPQVVEYADAASAADIAPAAGAGGPSGSADPLAHTSPSGSPARKNLIVVYLESVEDALADDELFQRNMLEPVQRATDGWATIEGLEQYDGGGWTMAGIVASQCGVPLRTATSSADRNFLNFEVKDPSYLGGATCLSDVLGAEGYRNVFMGGADASFASKRTFLETHGYDEVHDLTTWRAAGDTEVRSDWGLSDRRLMEHAKEEVSRLHDAGEPFHLSLLTLDTHESEFRHPYCRAVETFPRGGTDADEAAMRTSDMTDITRCSMEQVAGFIDHLDAEGILDDTVVVVMGDHLKMEAEWSAFWPELHDLPGRTIFNRVWVPGGVQFAPESSGIDQLSLYPTLLELTGLELVDRRAGIGVSALASDDEVPAGTIRDLDEAEYADLVASRSADFYAGLWAAEP